MSLNLKPQKYYRPKIFTNDELNLFNKRIINIGPIFYSYYDELPTKVNFDYIFYVPRNGKYHDLEYDWLNASSKLDSGCHYYSGLVPFDMYYHYNGFEEKGSCCNGLDNSCPTCGRVMIMKRWWKKFNS